MNKRKNIRRQIMDEENTVEYLAVHQKIVKKVLASQPDEENLYDLAELFKVFGDSTRIRILYALIQSELCVGDLAQILNMTTSAISHQLRILKDAKLIKFRRDGKIIFYSLDDDHVRTLLSSGMEHVTEK
jgi:ArsR family transcriptional regulator, lead/cadmium/zinc/bismuth-responsive transcriptional repressor